MDVRRQLLGVASLSTMRDSGIELSLSLLVERIFMAHKLSFKNKQANLKLTVWPDLIFIFASFYPHTQVLL